MNNYIKKIIIISIMLFVSINSIGAIYPIEKRSEKKFIKMALNMDSIIENDFIEIKNKEVINQVYLMNENPNELFGPTEDEIQTLSLVDLYYINTELIKNKIASMKIRDVKKEIKIAIVYLSQLNEVDENLIMAIVKKESYFNPKAKSYKNAKGLMQLMPNTAKEMGVEDIYNPIENLKGGIKYFKLLLTKFNGNESLALAAYNAGPYAVIRYKGIPPYNETIEYVKTILKFRKEYNEINKRTI